MILFRRFITILALIVIWGLLELVLWRPHWYFAIIGITEIAVIFFLFILGRGKINLKEFGSLLISPFFFIGAGFLFLFFLEGIIYQQLLIVILIFFWWIFLENTFLFLYQPVRYQPYALENITSYLNLITVFLLGSSFHSFIIFLGFPSFFFAPLIFVLTFFLVAQIIWINKLPIKEHLSLISILALLLSEMFWVTKFLPSSYLVNGIILALSYYFLTGIARHWALKNLDRQVVKRYLLISVIVLLITAFTARWT